MTFCKARPLGRIPGIFLALLMLFAWTGLVAAQDAPKPITTSWIVTVKPGQAQAFEAAVKTHLAWRKQAGDPMHWRTYTPVAGDRLDYYVFRSEGHEWADFDAEAAWELKANAGQQWEKQPGQYASGYSHHYHELDAEHSNWQDSDSYRYFRVTTLALQPGAGKDFYDALKVIKAAAVAGEWPRGWGMENTVGGSGDPIVVWPYASFAEMTPIEPGFESVLAKHLGSEEEAAAVFARLNGAIASSDTTIYVHRPDLSTQE